MRFLCIVLKKDVLLEQARVVTGPVYSVPPNFPGNALPESSPWAKEPTAVICRGLGASDSLRTALVGGWQSYQLLDNT